MKQELHPHSNNISVIFAVPKSAIVELEGIYNFLHKQCATLKPVYCIILCFYNIETLVDHQTATF